MILLDTHIWFWWVQGHSDLRANVAHKISAAEGDGLAVSAISLLEVARASSSGRMALPLPTEEWLEVALAYPGIRLIPLTPAIVVESCRLPEPFHKDPADRIIVATSRVLGIPLLTEDDKIVKYHAVSLA